jgi:hypothetical protein
MKNIKILLATAIIAAFTLTSCSKDDKDSAPVTNGSITEKWNPIKTIITGVGINTTQPYADNVATCDKNFLEFTATTSNFVVFYKNSTGVCQQDAPNTATYSKSGNNLIITGGRYNGNYTITTLSGSELIIKSVGTQSGVEITATTYFTKAATN